MSMTTGPHWSTAIFSCCCILVGSLSLIEAIQDSKRLITKMSSDGLILKHLAVDSKLALAVHCLLSICLQFTLSTLNLIFMVSFMYLWLDSILGLVVTYRRYCNSSRPSQLKGSKPSHGYDVLGRQHHESDSDETDIDAAVDDYKNQIYVSTVMQWNGSEVTNNHCPDNNEHFSLKVPCLLFCVVIVILIIASAMCWISNLNSLSLAISMLSFIIYNVILFIIWTHPQRLTASNPILKVPCVPWIPIGSTLFSCIMLFQLPILSWINFIIWICLGTIIFCQNYKG